MPLDLTDDEVNICLGNGLVPSFYVLYVVHPTRRYHGSRSNLGISAARALSDLKQSFAT